jgi:hypothetical protein
LRPRAAEVENYTIRWKTGTGLIPDGGDDAKDRNKEKKVKNRMNRMKRRKRRREKNRDIQSRDRSA